MTGLDPDMLVRDALDVYLARNGLEQASYAEPLFPIPPGPITRVLPNPGYTEIHDMHPIVLGAPPTFWGAVQVSALDRRSGPPTVLITELCLGAFSLGLLLRPRKALRWWRQY